MRKLIHKYLSQNFCIVNGQVLSTSSFPTREIVIFAGGLTDELITVFGLTKKELKWYVKSWIKGQSKSFNFNRWWKPPFGDIAFPMIRQISSVSIGTHLIEVQPMPMPSNNLFYLNYLYGETPAICPSDFNPQRGISRRYASVQVNPDYYEQINIGQPVGISSRAPTREETIEKWKESGILDCLTNTR